MKAVNHVLQQLQIDLDNFIPQAPLRPVNPETEERRYHQEKGGSVIPYVVNRISGEATWDRPVLEGKDGHLRLSLCPDEGSPLYTVFQYLSLNDVCVMLNRDSLQLVLQKAVRSCLVFL